MSNYVSFFFMRPRRRSSFFLVLTGPNDFGRYSLPPSLHPSAPPNSPPARPQGEADRPDPGGFLPRGWPRGAGARADAAPEDAGEASAEGGDDVRPSPGGLVAVPPWATVSAAGEKKKLEEKKTIAMKTEEYLSHIEREISKKTIKKIVQIKQPQGKSFQQFSSSTWFVKRQNKMKYE